jgi:hypothetical protein
MFDEIDHAFAEWRRRWSTPAWRRARTATVRNVQLRLEELEDRRLLTGNANNWVSLGPSPQTYQTPAVGMQAPNETTSGRVSSLAYGQFNNNPVLYVGAAGGGVWRSSSLNGGALTWTPLTDNIPMTNPQTVVGAGAIDTGSIAVSGQNVYVGTGEAKRLYGKPGFRYHAAASSGRA